MGDASLINDFPLDQIEKVFRIGGKFTDALDRH
jgi:hypothetical protein